MYCRMIISGYSLIKAWKVAAIQQKCRKSCELAEIRLAGSTINKAWDVEGVPLHGLSSELATCCAYQLIRHDGKYLKNKTDLGPDLKNGYICL